MASRLEVQSSIRQARGASGSGRSRLRQALVAGEFALASMLVASAGLLLASFQRIQNVDLGFQPRNVLTARMSLPAAKYSFDRTLAFHRDLDRELNAMPGVQAAGIVRNAPFAGYGEACRRGRPKAVRHRNRRSRPPFRWQREGISRRCKIPLRRGRLFDERDQARSARSALLSEGLALRLWPDGQDPIGRQVRFGDNPPATVVGVVADVRQSTLAEDAAPTAYVASWFLRDFFIVIRAPGEPAQLAAALRQYRGQIGPGAAHF